MNSVFHFERCCVSPYIKGHGMWSVSLYGQEFTQMCSVSYNLCKQHGAGSLLVKKAQQEFIVVLSFFQSPILAADID